MGIDQGILQQEIQIEDPLDEAPPPIPIEEHSKLRRMYTDEPPGNQEDILIVDSAADISCVGRGFSILSHSGETMTMNTALSSLPSNTFDIVSAAAVIIDPSSSTEVIIIINQAIYIPDLNQHESLLHSDQAHHHNVCINDLPTCYYNYNGRPGQQNIEVEGRTIPLRHDGRKYFLKIREPQKEDWDKCQVIELTSPEAWNYEIKMRRSKRTEGYTDEEIKQWSHRLGRLNLEATKYTLAGTMQLIKNVEAESRTFPRKHLKCRLPCLRPRRLTEGFSSDTFFPNVRTSRGYTCVQVFVGTKSGYTYIVPLKTKAYAYTALQDFIRQVGAPLFIAVDAAKEENIGEWLSVCRTYCIPQRTSEPTYQNQNRVERRIQDVKRRTTILMSIHNTPSRYWDYAVEYSVELINHTAVRKLGWRTPYEVLMGDTPDISVFRFIFYETIYYLEPGVQFPKANMLPGRLMGIARTTGDAFTFVIMTDDGIKSIALHRSVVKRRDSTNKDIYADYNTEDPQVSIGETESPDPVHTCDNNLNNEEHIPIAHEHNEILLNESSPGTIFAGDAGDIKDCTREVYNHFNPELKCDDIDDIISSKFGETDGKLYIQVRWKDGQESYINADLLQADDPLRLAKFIKEKPVECLRNGFWSQWADKMLRDISNVTRRVQRMYYNTDLKDSHYPYSRRITRRKKVYPIKMETFMGIEIPRNTKEAMYLDDKNKDRKWGDAMGKEIGSIQEHGTLMFLPPGAKPPK
jgi:hypothetical protein